MPQTSFWRRGAYIPLLAVLAYLPALAAGFVYDDTRLITENAYVQHAAHFEHAFLTHFWDVSGSGPMAETARYYRPLVTLSYLANWLLSPGRAWAFHLTNVLLHGLNTWLVLRIGQRFSKSSLIAAACALLFALHPTRAEAVIWISGRPDPLMTLFVLGAVELAELGQRKGWRVLSAVGVAAAFSAALMCKEPALAAPILLGVGALTAAPEGRRWQLSMVGLTSALAALYLALRSVFLPVDAPALRWTPLHALVTSAHYAERSVLPWPLTFFYKPLEFGATGPLHSPSDLAVGGLVVVAFVHLAIQAFRRDRPALLLLIAAAAFVGPLLNAFETGSKFTVADRFLYLPLWLFALGLGRLFEASWVRLLDPVRGRLVGAGVLALYVALTSSRALDFASPASLWDSELAHNPNNPVALSSRAANLAGEGRRDLAISYLERSLRRESLRFGRLATPDRNTDAYGRLVALRAQGVPDGADGALRGLVADAVDRLAGRPRSGRSTELHIDWPLDAGSARYAALKGEGILAGHLVPVVTRLDLHDISLTLLDAIPDRHLHLAPNPLLIAIGEGREQRFDRARRRLDTMNERRELMPSVVTTAALADVDLRLRSAQADFSRGASSSESDGHFARMQAFATLGAYGRALLEAQHVQGRQSELLPLFVQLLVFARMESTALSLATRALGQERAQATVDSIVRQLPPDLAALDPVGRAP